ncbi:MAG: TolC family protein [Cephaloticoccus sp.]|nr:TolC family protein [Cephaloticoccus sp.]MCF7760674.1 TolC family protein [Cephaloticoccus sp.]
MPFLHRLFLSLACTGALTVMVTATTVDSAIPLSLDEAIRLALENNQSVKVSAYDPLIGRAGVLAAYGSFDPALTFARSEGETEEPGTYISPQTRPLTQSDNYSLTLDGLTPWGMTYSVGATALNQRGTFNGFTDSYSTFGGISITQPLLRDFGFGSNLAGLRVARANRGITEWQHRQTVIDTVTNVIYVFNNLQQAHDNLRIARLSRDLAARLLDENQKRRRVGSISDADVTQAEARVANREEAILSAERSVRDIENQLRRLLGRTDFPTNGNDLAIVELPPSPPITVSAIDDYRTALDIRPDYQAARLGLKIVKTNDTVARNQLLPRVDFVGSYGHGGLDPNFRTARDQVRDRDARAYSAGFVVRVPLAFAEGRGRARAARLTLRQTEADLVRLEQDIALGVSAAAGQIETTQHRVEVSRRALELAHQALDAEEKRLKAGTSTTFFVLQQQELLAQVENSYARALADQRRALATYERETGTTLERHQITLTDLQP